MTAPPPDPPTGLRGALHHLRRRAPALLLLLGGMLVATLLRPTGASVRARVLVQQPADVVRLDMRWVPSVGASTTERADDTVAATSWRFSAGAAPPSLETTLNVPRGRYAVELTAETRDGRSLRVVRVTDVTTDGAIDFIGPAQPTS